MNPYQEVYSMIDRILVAKEGQESSRFYWELLCWRESELFYKGMMLTKFSHMVYESSMRCLTCDEVKSLEIHGGTQESMQPVISAEHLWILSQQGIHIEKV